jgi:UDP-glucuronate decarboxylase
MNNIVCEDMQFIYNSGIDWGLFKNSAILISGATGMLPSYMTTFLLYLCERHPEYNIKVIALARNKEKAYKRFTEYFDKDYFHLILTDVCEPVIIEQKVDYIIHAASFASPQYYGVDPVGTLLPNILGTYQLLQLSQQHNVKGFLFFSSGEIYGQVFDKDSISESDYGYLDPVNIRSCYGESKRMGENICKSYQHQYGIPAKIVRIFHTYGPTMDIENDNRVFAEFVSDIVHNRDIVMKSDGTPVRPFCYITDAIVAFFMVLLNGNPGEAYNVSNSECLISMRDLAETLVSIFPEKQLKVIRKDREKSNVYIENTKPNTAVANCNKIKELGWTPKYNIYEGFKRTIESFIYN